MLKIDTPIEKLFATTDGECKFEELPESLTRKDKKVFYPNLNVELNRQKISYKNLAESLGVRKVTISNTLSGKIKLDEKTARAIYELLKVDMPLEKLFMTVDGEYGIKKTKKIFRGGKRKMIYPNLRKMRGACKLDRKPPAQFKSCRMHISRLKYFSKKIKS